MDAFRQRQRLQIETLLRSAQRELTRGSKYYRATDEGEAGTLDDTMPPSGR